MAYSDAWQNTKYEVKQAWSHSQPTNRALGAGDCRLGVCGAYGSIFAQLGFEFFLFSNMVSASTAHRWAFALAKDRR